jgi:ketosteroid isomerase-like protein
MKPALLIAALIASIALLAACTSSGEQTVAQVPTISAAPAAADTERIVAQLQKYERDWVAAIVAKDEATIDRLLSDDFAGTTNDQRYSKADAIEDVKSGRHESLTLDEIDIRVFGDAAIATMVQNEKSRHDNEDFSGRYLFTNVWVNRNSEWRAVASHGSRSR